MNQHNNNQSASGTHTVRVLTIAHHQWFLPALLAVLLAGLASRGTAAVITYDGSATPNSPTLPFAFSWEVQANTSWSVSSGVLAMTTTPYRAIWFGNERDFRPPPWLLADHQAGNYVIARAKLMPNSGQWQCYINDDTHYAGWYFNAGEVLYTTATNSVSYHLDTTAAFHDYAFLLWNGQVTYSVDGVQIYSGPALASVNTRGPVFVIGDGSGSGPTGFGTFLLDDLKIITEAKQPRASIRVSQVEVCWQSFTNTAYQVQYRSSLTTNLWADLESPIQGDGTTLCVTDAVPPGQPQRFYRVVARE